jgi:two-component system response regulator QseB
VELPRVLLVEDERELAEMLARLLQTEGFAVDLAEDGHAALHLGLTRRYRLLLIDRGLPAIEGSTCSAGCAPRA